jgi:hypothetical protein
MLSRYSRQSRKIFFFIFCSPALLGQLEASTDPVPKLLCAEAAKANDDLVKVEMNEKVFRWMLNEDQASFKMAF